jgi:4-diphosphocytidyl-2-C-methyl-D-erythritol kinase
VTKRESGSLPEHSSVTVRAPAKVNLILRILDRRPDGYHNLWSVMQTVALEDELRIGAVSRPGGIRLSCDTKALSADRSNLVYKAASAVLEQARLSLGLDIELRKRIPMGAGLGGGSSDAAATIVGLNKLLKLGWSTADMKAVGEPLGSDVPFFLFAPAAVVSGRGETVTPVSIEESRWLVLVKPAFGVETKWAYQELAASRSRVRPLTPAHVMLNERRRISWSELTAAAENDFEEPVFSKHGTLRKIKHTLREQGAECALLAGSGATVFGIFADESEARQAEQQMCWDQQLQVFVVPTCSEPLIVAEHQALG